MRGRTMMTGRAAVVILMAVAGSAVFHRSVDAVDELPGTAAARTKSDAVQARLDDIRSLGVGEHDSPQLGGSRLRNNTPHGVNIPEDVLPGEYDRESDSPVPGTSRNVKWVARLGSQTWGTPVVANGRVFIGTNNRAVNLKRYPRDDLGCLVCFRESDGGFLWQHSNEKLASGRVNDWPEQGVCSSPVVEGDRLWYVSNRGEIVCLDAEGFHDGEDDGPVLNEEVHLFRLSRQHRTQPSAGAAEAIAGLAERRLTQALREQLTTRGFELPEPVQIEQLAEDVWRIETMLAGEPRTVLLRADDDANLRASMIVTPRDRNDADVVWKLDMMNQLNAFQHNMATCGPTILGDLLFVCTSNGVDEGHQQVVNPDAPSFIAVNKQTGEVVWTDNSPGENILHGQWSCPVVAELGGVPQVIFPGGDGWLYSFRADRWQGRRPELLWKFDANPKHSRWDFAGRGNRNNLIAVPVVYEGRVYAAVGQDPEHGEGPGLLWCIDPTRRGDVSPEIVVDAAGNVVPHRREVAIRDWQQVGKIDRAIRDELNEGRVTDQMRAEFRNSGIDLPPDSRITVVESDLQWLIEPDGGQPDQRLRVTADSANGRPPRRTSLVVERSTGESIRPNPNSAVVWHYDGFDADGDGKREYGEVFHRTICSPAIRDGLLIIPDLPGFVHCLNAETGQVCWTCDLLSACWSTPLIVEDKVYIGDEDGMLHVLKLSTDPDVSLGQHTLSDGYTYLSPLKQIEFPGSLYSTPVVANNVLYVADRRFLYAIASP